MDGSNFVQFVRLVVFMQLVYLINWSTYTMVEYYVFQDLLAKVLVRFYPPRDTRKYT